MTLGPIGVSVLFANVRMLRYQLVCAFVSFDVSKVHDIKDVVCEII